MQGMISQLAPAVLVISPGTYLFIKCIMMVYFGVLYCSILTFIVVSRSVMLTPSCAMKRHLGQQRPNKILKHSNT